MKSKKNPNKHKPSGVVFWNSTHTPIGSLFIAATQKGVFHLSFLSREKGLKAVRRKHPQFTVYKNDVSLKKKLKNLVNHLICHGNLSTLPLDLIGTNFQIAVWKAMMDIPSGKTRSYLQIARRIGKPAAVRAVGTACAQNSIALLIPCHRVIRNNGSLGGYAWGIERKKYLLQLEREFSVSA